MTCSGFTLAEVLITLAIIGIVAAITIPTLIDNIQDKHFKTLWKKTFSEISQAYILAFGENPINVPRVGRDPTIKPYSKEIYYQVLSRLTDDYCLRDVTQGKDCNRALGFINPPCKSLNNDYQVGACMYASNAGYGKLNNGVVIYLQGYLWTQPAFTIDLNGSSNGPNVVVEIYLWFYSEVIKLFLLELPVTN